MISTIVIVLYLLIFALDFLPVIKNKDKKITSVYAVLFFASFCVLFLYTLEVEIPSISVFIYKLIYFDF